MDKTWFKSLLVELRVGIAVSDGQGKIIFLNNVWCTLPEIIKQFAEAKLLELKPGKFICSQTETLISIVTLADTLIAIVHREDEQLVVKDSILSLLINSMAEHKNIFDAAAKAMGKHLSWRWVLVNRYLTNHKAETLAFWDNNALVKNFEYDLNNTPCNRVRKEKKFVRIDDVLQDFPEDEFLLGMGVKTYAGYVYRNKNNEVLGHVFLMHDNNNIDWILTEETLHMVSTIVGATLSLSHSEKEVKKQKGLAHTDALTQLNNRLAFDSDLKTRSNVAEYSPEEQFVLAMIDLDGMKHVNDNLGHSEGDRLLQIYAKELKHMGREKDRAYRFGGDEFAIVFVNTHSSQISKLKQRFEQAMLQVQQQGFDKVGASIGYASSEDFPGDVKSLIKTADERMYADKQSKMKGNTKG